MSTDDPLILLGRLEGKVDLILDHLREAQEAEAAQNQAIHAVEQKVWWASGAMAVLAALATKLGWPLLTGSH